jgi:multidrug efflux pump subunit AcrA (membrane-fusion protein)
VREKLEENRKEVKMNKKLALIILSLCFIVFLGACSQINPQEESPVVYDSSETSRSDVVIADGEIVPAKDVQLMFKVIGVVESVLVEEGQTVREGEVLFRLEDQQVLKADLEKARVEELNAQQALDDLFLYADMEKYQAYQDVLHARTQLNQVEAAWDDFDEDAYEDDLDDAEEKIADAKQTLEDKRDDLADYLDLDEDNTTRQNRQDAVDRAELDLNQKQRDRDELKQSYDQLRLDLDSAKARLATAEDAYDNFGQGPDQDLLAAAEQRLAAATAQVEALQSAISDLELTAPFNGTVVRVDITEGEFVRAAQMVAVLADFSDWYVETTDLNELEVTRVAVGDSVLIKTDAFEGEELTGTVIQIKDYAEINYSDVTYPVRIKINDTDLPLRWKMTVVVTFEE